jgi:hypothetical protein
MHSVTESSERGTSIGTEVNFTTVPGGSFGSPSDPMVMGRPGCGRRRRTAARAPRPA